MGACAAKILPDVSSETAIIPVAEEPPDSGTAEPEVDEKSTAKKVPAASCECIINSLTSSDRIEMECVCVCHQFLDLFEQKWNEQRKETRETEHATDRC